MVFMRPESNHLLSPPTLRVGVEDQVFGDVRV